jgi:glycosyltransferase involved in cell wall biosynthesis
MQEYRNYHVVIIDDASTDSTGEDVYQVMVTQKKLDSSRYLVIKNNERKMAMYNLRAAANVYCSPQDIFIVVDGDDQLLGRQVFKVFNAIFQ